MTTTTNQLCIAFYSCIFADIFIIIQPINTKKKKIRKTPFPCMHGCREPIFENSVFCLFVISATKKLKKARNKMLD